MKAKKSEFFPVIVCGGLIVLSVLLVVLGHRQGDSNAAAAATATAAAPAPSKPAAQLTVSPAAAAASALAKPAAAD